MATDAEVIQFHSIDEWESWLELNHDRPEGVWVKVAKKGSGEPSITITEALDGALCFGWIDSIRRGLDEKFYLQKYSPRRPKGYWSQVNIEKIERLVAEGRMRPAGIAQVDAAKADGRWDAAYSAQRTATPPDDLIAALALDAAASAAFDALGKTERFMIILSLEKARTPALRTKRLAQAIENLSGNKG